MYKIPDLLYCIDKLRANNEWDKQQTFLSVIPHTIEEVNEVIEAIHNKDYENLKEELGDLLLQILLYTRIAQDENLFSFYDIVNILTTKLIRRHPHIFFDEDLYTNKPPIHLTIEELEKQWNEIKKKEKLIL